MKLVKTEIQLNVYGTEVKLNEPTVKTVQAFQVKLDNKENNEFDIMLDFLEECGLPKSISEEMSANHISQVMELLVPKKD